MSFVYEYYDRLISLFLTDGGDVEGPGTKPETCADIGWSPILPWHGQGFPDNDSESPDDRSGCSGSPAPAMWPKFKEYPREDAVLTGSPSTTVWGLWKAVLTDDMSSGRCWIAPGIWKGDNPEWPGSESAGCPMCAGPGSPYGYVAAAAARYAYSWGSGGMPYGHASAMRWRLSFIRLFWNHT